MTAVLSPASGPPVGELLRDWRQRRRLSQLELSSQAEISTRHLSFVETGRSKPTPEMILRLSEHLEVPLRERNQLLLRGGYAPAYPQHELDAPELASVRAALRLVLQGHHPYPALIIDRWWNLVEANEAVTGLLEEVSAALLTPPVNVLRLTLHPEGLAPRIVNLAQWRAHLLQQLRRRHEATGDQRLAELHAELLTYPAPTTEKTVAADTGGIVLPMVLRRPDGRELSMFTIAAAVETSADVTVQELTIESFYPADEATAAHLRGE